MQICTLPTYLGCFTEPPVSCARRSSRLFLDGRVRALMSQVFSRAFFFLTFSWGPGPGEGEVAHVVRMFFFSKHLAGGRICVVRDWKFYFYYGQRGRGSRRGTAYRLYKLTAVPMGQSTEKMAAPFCCMARACVFLEVIK